MNFQAAKQTLEIFFNLQIQKKKSWQISFFISPAHFFALHNSAWKEHNAVLFLAGIIQNEKAAFLIFLYLLFEK